MEMGKIVGWMRSLPFGRECQEPRPTLCEPFRVTQYKKKNSTAENQANRRSHPYHSLIYCYYQKLSEPSW